MILNYWTIPLNSNILSCMYILTHSSHALIRDDYIVHLWCLPTSPLPFRVFLRYLSLSFYHCLYFSDFYALPLAFRIYTVHAMDLGLKYIRYVLMSNDPVMIIPWYVFIYLLFLQRRRTEKMPTLKWHDWSPSECYTYMFHVHVSTSQTFILLSQVKVFPRRHKF